MNETKTFNFKLPIMILAWVAVGLSSLSCINTLVKYEPGFFEFLSLMISLAPFVLFALYATIFHSNEKLTIFVPIVFALFAYYPIHVLFTNIIDSASHVSFKYFLSFMYNNAPVMALSVFAALGSLKGMKDKKFILLLLAVLLLPKWNSFGNLLTSSDNTSASFFTFCSITGAASGYVALLLFALNNEIPMILGASYEQEFAPEEDFAPEEEFVSESDLSENEPNLVRASAALMLDELNKQFELGKITQEEYLEARSQIINSL